MSLFQRLTKTFRPTSFSAASAFRITRCGQSPKPGQNFLENSKLLALGRRTFSRSSPYKYTLDSSRSKHASNVTWNKRLVWGFIGLNSGIFVYANYLKAQFKQGYQMPFLQYMKNMSLSVHGVLVEHRYWTLLSSTVSHLDIFHVAGNLLSFYFMAQLLTTTRGFTPVNLGVLIMGSGLAGSIGYLCQTLWSRPQQQRVALGFSGCVMGVGTVTACLYPRVQFLLYGIVPVPISLLMVGYAVYDGYYLNDKSDKIAHAGHLGGLAFGLVYYFARVRGLRL